MVYMTVRSILVYPDERLRERAEAVEKVDAAIRELVEDMAETAPGVGLAANQIGVLKRVFVIDIADESEPSDLKVFINPEILDASGSQTYQEGCLSFPNATEEIKRAERVRVRALDVQGKPFELEAEGLLAVAIQHENDHLDGVLMIDKLGPIKRRRLGRKIKQARDEVLA